MADVTTTFGAKDVGVAATISRLTQRLAGFQASMTGVSASAKRMQGSFSGLGRSVIGLAAAYVGVSQAMGSFRKALEVGGRLDDLSKVTGEAAGNLMLLEKAFDLSGAGAQKVGMALAGMARFINDLKSGQAGAAETARRLGINLADLAGKTPTEQMRVLLEAIGGVTDANERLGLSMDVFKKVGKDLIPLAADFNGELGKAQKFLGSAPELMNTYAEKLASVGDNMAAIGEKGDQFMMGFIAGAKGIDDMTEAMANFDAAAAGFDFGKIISGSMQEPGQAFVGLGEILLLGVMKAGNALIDAVAHAGIVYQKFMTDPKTLDGIFGKLADGFSLALNIFNKGFYSIVKTMFGFLGTMGFPMVDETIAEIEKLQKQLDNQSDALGNKVGSNINEAADRFYKIAEQTPKRELNTFNIPAQKAEADAAVDLLRQLGQPVSKADEFFKKINQIYQAEVEAIHAATQDRAEQLRRLEVLRAQYQEAAIGGIKRLGEPTPGLTTPQAQVQPGTLPQSSREEMARQASAVPTSPGEEVASETTLQRVASLMESLNTKLPQPVLV